MKFTFAALAAVSAAGLSMAMVQPRVDAAPQPAVTSANKATSCVPTVTVTKTPGVADGCQYDCIKNQFFIDTVVTIPCGCSTIQSISTKTVTACATSSPCWDAHTGFMFTTTATNCPKTTKRA